MKGIGTQLDEDPLMWRLSVYCRFGGRGWCMYDVKLEMIMIISNGDDLDFPPVNNKDQDPC